jgi:hypothetical protein
LFKKFNCNNYIEAVDLSLQQVLVAVAGLVQHFLPFAHFFFLPLSANVTAVTNNAAVANNKTFFICIIFIYFINVNVG